MGSNSGLITGDLPCLVCGTLDKESDGIHCINWHPLFSGQGSISAAIAVILAGKDQLTPEQRAELLNACGPLLDNAIAVCEAAGLKVSALPDLMEALRRIGASGFADCGCVSTAADALRKAGL